MAYQTVFRRYELKYMLTEAQKEILLKEISRHMEPDRYGKTTIRNIYFDTENYRLIRRSLEKPVYKEKLRVRSYTRATPESTVFAELKKKYEGVVYKRRLPLPEGTAMAWLTGGMALPRSTQISREIDYFMHFYGEVRPTVFLSYEREAYFDTEESGLRVTFDESILARREQVNLCAPVYGTPLLPAGLVLMELKCAGGLPLWMVRLLSREGIRKTSFSKYGTAYEKLIFPEIQNQKTMEAKEKLIHGCHI